MRETSGLHPPEGLIANITKLHSLNPSMERVHYLKFLIAMRTGNLNDAEESLHRFYDYSKRFGNAFVLSTPFSAKSVGRQ
ncbi:hypothetical protein DFJ73DRAFT_300407 [Zopfochytrium polystomum]|nr:hypothetical protein DFJ73DRAFT_300407 [Zopfochytrium polystomum]